MYYIKRKRGKRMDDDAPRMRGGRITFISLAAAGAFIAVIKANNPGMNIKPMTLMFIVVALGCFSMNVLSRRGKKDD